MYNKLVDETKQDLTKLAKPTTADLKKIWYQDIIAKYLQFLRDWQGKIIDPKAAKDYQAALLRLEKELPTAFLFESLDNHPDCIRNYIYKTYPDTQLKDDVKNFEQKKITFTDIDKRQQFMGLKDYLDYLKKILVQYKDDLLGLYEKMIVDQAVPAAPQNKPVATILAINISASTQLKLQCSQFVGQNSTVLTDLTRQLHSKDKAKLQELISKNINTFYDQKKEYKRLCLSEDSEYHQSIALQLLVGYANMLDVFMDDKAAKFLLPPADFAVVLANCYELLNWFFVEFTAEQVKVDMPLELQSPYISVFEINKIDKTVKINEAQKKKFLNKVWSRYEDISWRNYFAEFIKKL